MIKQDDRMIKHDDRMSKHDDKMSKQETRYVITLPASSSGLPTSATASCLLLSIKPHRIY